MIGERSDILVNAIDVDNIIVGTNSNLSSEFQMSDPNLRWLKNIILAKKTSKEKFELDKETQTLTSRRNCENTCRA